MTGGGLLNLIHSTLNNNWGLYGGGLYCDGGTRTVTNTSLWKNSASLGPEIYRVSGKPGTPAFRFCDIRGRGGPGALWNPALGTDNGGNIMADPLFADTGHPIGADGIWRTPDDGLRLTLGSPCIDTGQIANAPTTDILGNARVGAPDIGAYEGG